MTPLRVSWRLAQVAVLMLTVRLVNRLTPAEPVWKQVATGKRAPVGKYEAPPGILGIRGIITALIIVLGALCGYLAVALASPFPPPSP